MKVNVVCVCVGERAVLTAKLGGGAASGTNQELVDATSDAFFFFVASCVCVCVGREGGVGGGWDLTQRMSGALKKCVW